jgi:hypothetical protein
MGSSGLSQVLSLGLRAGEDLLSLTLPLRPSVGDQLVCSSSRLGDDLLADGGRLALSIFPDSLCLELSFADDSPGPFLDLQDLAHQSFGVVGLLEHDILSALPRRPRQAR